RHASLPSRRPIRQNTPWLLSPLHIGKPILSTFRKQPPLPDVEKLVSIFFGPSTGRGRSSIAAMSRCEKCLLLFGSLNPCREVVTVVTCLKFQGNLVVTSSISARYHRYHLFPQLESSLLITTGGTPELLYPAAECQG